jgi:hypothetical protein
MAPWQRAAHGADALARAIVFALRGVQCRVVGNIMNWRFLRGATRAIQPAGWSATHSEYPFRDARFAVAMC